MDKSFSRLSTKKMEMIAEALRQDAEGVTVSATCPICGTRLLVKHIDEIGSTWVSCEKGCTTAHIRRTLGHVRKMEAATQK